MDERRRIESTYLQGALPHHEYRKLIDDLNKREHDYAMWLNTTRFRAWET
jgi:hypothetical protein